MAQIVKYQTWPVNMNTVHCEKIGLSDCALNWSYYEGTREYERDHVHR